VGRQHPEPWNGTTDRFGSIAVESVRADPYTECRRRLGRWISAEPIEDKADNLFGNWLGFTRLLAGGRELVRLWAAREAAGQRVSAAA
jgi:hypothetical protein